MKRMVTIYVSDSDPGRDILMADAKRTATKALRSGEMNLHVIKDADHTFSWTRSRADLINKLLESLVKRYDA